MISQNLLTERTMPFTSTKKLSKAIHDVPGLPDTMADLLVRLADDNFSMQDISAVVARDPGLTAQVIKRSNSAFFGFVWKASTAEEAAPRLGRSGLMELVLGEQLGAACAHMGPSGNLLWRHSMATALVARRLAEHLKYDDPSLAYTAGLMHDAGKLVMNQSFAAEAAEIRHLVQKMRWEIAESEKHVLGLDHTEMGLLVAKKWNLSKQLAQIMNLHHRLSKVKSNRRLLMIVALANAFAKNCGAASYTEQYRCEYTPDVLFYLNLSQDNVAFLEKDAAKLIADSGDLLHLS